MGDEIKSTLELALEKAEKFGRATKEELEWERTKERALGIVGRFLKGEITDLEQEVNNFFKGIPQDVQRKSLRVIVETLLKNLNLPREERQLEESKRILSGLKALLKRVPKIDQLFQEMERLLKDYFHHKETIYQELLKRFSVSISALERAVSEQIGAQVRLSPEAHPQFKEEWTKIKEHLDNEYGKQLEYMKSLLLKIVS